MTTSPTALLTIAAITAVGSAINAVAGGGTLLTFPALIALGVPPVAANATSTVALLPGSFSSMMGYRRELTGARSWAVRFAVPSLLGGATGAALLLLTSEKRFAALVPWLVLGATLLFAVQKPVVRWILSRKAANGAASASIALSTSSASSSQHRDASAALTPHTDQPAVTQLAPPTTGLLIAQFFVGVYGGYFGAGAGIIMLAALGFMGLTNIHQMNGLKNWGGVCMNGIAALTFVVMGIVNWPIALAMATGGVIGGYTTAGLARRAPQQLIRNLVTLIGLSAAVWLFVR